MFDIRVIVELWVQVPWMVVEFTSVSVGTPPNKITKPFVEDNCFPSVVVILKPDVVISLSIEYSYGFI